VQSFYHGFHFRHEEETQSEHIVSRIVLISCVSRKGKIKAKARDLYKGPLFRYSLECAELMKHDKIFILSAKHHLLDLDKEIEPYNVTIGYVSPKERLKKPDLIVLSKEEVKIWGQNVAKELSKYADLKNDTFIILAGMSYIKPIENALTNIVLPLKGLSQGKKLKLLKSKSICHP
jgi:hypothetical protein